MQGGALCHGDEHVRERVLPHGHEHHAILGSGVRAEGPQSALCLLGPLGERAALALRHNRHNTHHHLLHREGSVRGKPVLNKFPRWQPLARLVPLAKSFNRLRFPYADCVRVLRAAPALFNPSQHEQQPSQAEIEGHSISYSRSALVFHLLDAKPSRDFLGRPGETGRLAI